MAFSPDGTTLATSRLLDVVLWDLKGQEPKVVRTLKAATGKLQRDLDDYPSQARVLAYSPDGKTLAAGHYNSGGVRLWDMTGDLRQEVAWLDAGTTGTVAFSPDGKTLASVGSGNSGLAPGCRVLLWDVTQKPPKLQHALPTQRYGIAGVAFSPDGKTTVSGGADGLLRLWDLSGKDPKAKLPVRGHDDEIRQTALSPDGKALATTSWDGTLRLWDFGGARPKPRETFRAVSAFATALCFTADGKRLVTGNSDASVRIWDVSTGTARLQKTLSHGRPDSAEERDEIWGLAVSTDGKVAVTSGRFHGLASGS